VVSVSIQSINLSLERTKPGHDPESKHEKGVEVVELWCTGIEFAPNYQAWEEGGIVEVDFP